MAFKGLVVDVDGTIADERSRIDLDASALLRWLYDSGYHVILASGRGHWDTISLAIYLGLTPTTISENGGVISYSLSDIAILADIAEPLKAYDLIASRIGGVRMKSVSPRFTEVVLERSFDLEQARRVIEESGLGVAIADSQFAYHMMCKAVSKESGLDYASAKLGVKPKELVAIGDSETDIPLFRACMYGIALANSPPFVKQVASYVVGSPNGQGLAEAVRHVLLKFCFGMQR